MAKDHFTASGLNTPQMMAEAIKYRNEFEIKFVDLVDIVSIIEFRLVARFPRFQLVVKRDSEMLEDARADPLKDRITVRKSVYVAACEGVYEARLVLAHELGHFLLHREKDVVMHKDPRGAVQSIGGVNALESTEDQADMFARHFLAPPHLSYRLRNDPEALAVAAGIPLRIARGNATMSRWPEVRGVRRSAERHEEIHVKRMHGILFPDHEVQA
ncbi:ImmA/IrrE family metallo-endopeptidase [Rhizobium bangladeshense]|uniref:ImmA/IrrE family metallo-endopeptidase n=1 Tax=Rhizobium bangladeshense TaxID=1138189 RepID=UPI001A981649|nr:ImmA/IrrE family metallo-endopeptidase [Rhizobium bangladeshense]QSY96049.1 ImmA/IrrE family metallo-endopeptidase [Rhizobium bangladeshense]